jgi:hypothetical protein
VVRNRTPGGVGGRREQSRLLPDWNMCCQFECCRRYYAGDNFIHRKSKLTRIDKVDIAEITEKLNYRPRKALDYLTRNEVY